MAVLTSAECKKIFHLETATTTRLTVLYPCHPFIPLSWYQKKHHSLTHVFVAIRPIQQP